MRWHSEKRFLLRMKGMLFALLSMLALLAFSGAIAATPKGQLLQQLQQREQSSPPTCVNLVVNGDFEQGVSEPDPWVLGGHAEVSDERPHSGYFGVWVGGYQNADDTLYQLVSIPDDAETVTFRYWWNIHSLDAVETPYDYLYVKLQTADGQPLAELETLDNTDVRNAWTQSSFDLSAYAGTSLRLFFHCTGNERFITSFFLDDVELEACGDMVRCYLPLVWHAAQAGESARPLPLTEEHLEGASWWGR